jgi:hypothetical protein
MAQHDSAVDNDATLAVSGLEELLEKSRQPSQTRTSLPSAAVGELLAVLDGGRTAIIAVHRSVETHAMRARTTIDLHADHIGRPVVLLFEGGDDQRPIVVGVVRADRAEVPSELTGAVNVSADGERMIVSAHRELVLQCGKASLTLQQDGTIRIVGERILSRATGPNRVQGGSVELN